MSTDQNQIRDLLATYERSLNTSDADLAAFCYAAESVFLPTTLPTVTGPTWPTDTAGSSMQSAWTSRSPSTNSSSLPTRPPTP